MLIMNINSLCMKQYTHIHPSSCDSKLKNAAVQRSRVKVWTLNGGNIFKVESQLQLALNFLEDDDLPFLRH